MESRPRLTAAVLEGLMHLGSLGYQASMEEADRWWKPDEQVLVMKALVWIRRMRKWRKAAAEKAAESAGREK